MSSRSAALLLDARRRMRLRVSSMRRVARLAVVALAGRLPIRGYRLAALLHTGDLDELFWIPPARINSLIRRRKPKPVLGSRFLTDAAAWEDGGIEDLHASKTARTIDQLFVQGLHYKETDQYHVMRRAVAKYRRGEIPDPSRKGAYWCRSFRDIDEYFAILQRAFNDIERNGYRTQEVLRRTRPADSRGSLDEILISIASDGSPVLRNGGTHRTLIAQHLEVAVVPVRIVTIDRSWAERNLTARGRPLTRQLQDALAAAAPVHPRAAAEPGLPPSSRSTRSHDMGVPRVTSRVTRRPSSSS